MCVYLATDLCLFAINEEFHYDKKLFLFFFDLLVPLNFGSTSSFLNFYITGALELQIKYE